MVTKETITQEALRLLQEVPKENWIEGRFTDEVGSCCAVGHYTRLKSSNPDDYSMTNCSDWIEGKEEIYKFRELTDEYITNKYGLVWYNVADVNNNDDVNGYNEDNPKDRVIHLLEDMIKDGY